MGRPLRIQYPGAWYHITSRGNERNKNADVRNIPVLKKRLKEILNVLNVEI